MIVVERLGWLRLLFTMRGSVLPRIAGRLAFVFIFACVVEAIDYFEDPILHLTLIPDLTLIPFTLIGLALSIFLGFRNNTSYDRFWEGRKLWGRMINANRTWSRQVLTLIDANPEAPTAHQAQLVRALVGYVHAFRAWLRREDAPAAAAAWIPEGWHAAVGGSTNPPARILQEIGHEVVAASRSGRLDPVHVLALDGTLTEIMSIQGGCERIRNTPIPFAYTGLMHRIVAAYCLALPFGIASSVGLASPLVVLFVSYAFLGLDAIGDEIEEPFGTDDNDLPLSQLSRVMERDALSALDVEAIPPAAEPIDGVLS